MELGSECFGFFPSSSSSAAAAAAGGKAGEEGVEGEAGQGGVGEGQAEGEGKEAFWREFRGADEGRLGLLTYYIARRG